MVKQALCFNLAYHLSKVVQEGQAASAEYGACCKEQPKLWSFEALYGSVLSKGNDWRAISLFIL